MTVLPTASVTGAEILIDADVARDLPRLPDALSKSAHVRASFSVEVNDWKVRITCRLRSGTIEAVRWPTENKRIVGKWSAACLSSVLFATAGIANSMFDSVQTQHNSSYRVSFGRGRGL